MNATLFDIEESQGRARATDPQTAHDAARRPGKVALKWRYLIALVDGGAQTDFEVAARLGVAQTSCGPRRPALMKAGLVVATGDRRPTPNGGDAAVYRATDAGVIEARKHRAP